MVDEQDRADALVRADDYLNMGGLFNPEVATTAGRLHDAVSLLIRDMRNLLLGDIVQEQIAKAMIRGAENAAYSERALCVTALREIVRLRLATSEGSLRVRSDRIWEIATKTLSDIGDGNHIGDGNQRASYEQDCGILRVQAVTQGEDVLARVDAALGVAQRHLDRIHAGTLPLTPAVAREIEASIERGRAIVGVGIE